MFPAPLSATMSRVGFRVGVLMSSEPSRHGATHSHNPAHLADLLAMCAFNDPLHGSQWAWGSCVFPSASLTRHGRVSTAFPSRRTV